VIKDLPSTSASAINKALIDLRESGGAIALGRVLTLLVVTDDADAERAIADANHASREHPCRILVAASGPRRGGARLDAQVRVGGDAGASEVVVLRTFGPLVDHVESVVVPLLLPDAPIVAWWPGAAPELPAEAPVGRLAQRRIVDSAAAPRPMKALAAQRKNYRPGDTDLAWSRLTLWRAVLAAGLDEAGNRSIDQLTVTGGADSPSAELMAAWLALRLRTPVTRARSRTGSGLVSVRITRKDGTLDVIRPDDEDATLAVPGKPPRRISLPKRPDRDCLAEELRRLDPDDVYADVVTKGLAKLSGGRQPSARQAESTGAAPSTTEAKKTTDKPVRPRRTPRRAQASEESQPAERSTSEAEPALAGTPS
jgi:glucose-6-phosphate dehydrogenase assembly protein OpcA